MKHLLIATASMLSVTNLLAQRIEPIEFGDMERWQKRSVVESKIIGGKSKTLYELTDKQTKGENIPFENTTSKWATSSVMAKVSGIYKGSVTVFPEKRLGKGTVARLETTLEEVKVLGIINIAALATGSIFLGQVNEPIRDTKNPQAKLMQGIPFTKRPSFVQFDYKFMNVGEGKRVMNTGFSKKDLTGKNAGEVCLILQQRWEDSEGNVYANRVGTGWKRYFKNAPQWVDNERVEVLYGDITKHNDYIPFMNLIVESPLYTRNSKGEIKEINEVGWADKDAVPTHIILRISSGFGGAYVGSPGAKMWIDNIALGYND